MVGAYDVGRVINPKIARSQCLGGMVGGIGMALLEQAEWIPRLGRVMNANLCGVAPAIANAVYHATGRRVGDLPITPEKLLAA